MSLPVLDFSPYLSDPITPVPTPAQQRVSRAIHRAFSTHGFLLLRNIRPPNLPALYDLTRRILRSPTHTHPALDPVQNVGHLPLRTEALNPERPADLKTTYTFPSPRYRAHDYQSLPKDAATLVEEFWAHVHNLAERFAVALAVALNLPVGFFLKAFKTYSSARVRISYFPEGKKLSEEHGEDALRVGEHTDFGLFTILYADAPGLQVQRAAGAEWQSEMGDEWIDVPVLENVAVVNVGALLARWTNDTWNATAHRVVARQGEELHTDRVSVAAFCDPDAHTLINAPDLLLTPDMPRKYPPVTAQEYIQRRLNDAQKKKETQMHH